MSSEQGEEVTTARQPPHVSLGERSLQLSRGYFAGEVEEGAGRCRHRYSVTGANVAADEGASSVYADARLLAGVAGGDGDVDVSGTGRVGEQSPQVSGAAVAEHRAAATGQHGSQLSCMKRGHRVA